MCPQQGGTRGGGGEGCRALGCSRWPLTRPSPARPAQRTEDELELIFEELLHIKAVAHLSNSVSAPHTFLHPLPNPPASSSSSSGPLQPSLGRPSTPPPHPERVPSSLGPKGGHLLPQVKRELAAVLMFESHQRAGTVREYRVAQMSPRTGCPQGQGPQAGWTLPSVQRLQLDFLGPGTVGTETLTGAGWDGADEGFWGSPQRKPIVFFPAVFSQGDKGTSWYIVWKGSVNVVTHGKVCASLRGHLVPDTTACRGVGLSRHPASPTRSRGPGFSPHPCPPAGFGGHPARGGRFWAAGAGERCAPGGQHHPAGGQLPLLAGGQAGLQPHPQGGQGVRGGSRVGHGTSTPSWAPSRRCGMRRAVGFVG